MRPADYEYPPIPHLRPSKAEWDAARIVTAFRRDHASGVAEFNRTVVERELTTAEAFMLSDMVRRAL